MLVKWDAKVGHRVGQSEYIQLNQVCLLECMLFQIASPTFFNGLPNNDHPELGQSQNLSVRVV